MQDMTGTSRSSGTPSNVEKSPLDFSNEDPPPLITKRVRTKEQGQDELSLRIAPVGNPPYTEVAPEPYLEKETVAMGALVNKRRRKGARARRKQMHYPRKCLLSRHKSRVKKGSKLLLKSLRNTRMTGHGLRLAIIKCAEFTELRQVFVDVVSAGIAKGMSEGLKHGVDHGKAKVDLAAIEAYDSKADTKYVTAFHALKDLKYPLFNPLEKLKDAPIDVTISSRKAVVTEDHEFEKSTSFTSMVGSPGSIYQPR
nr:hypothetical protein [Tanacetum cinerariifolium]